MICQDDHKACLKVRSKSLSRYNQGVDQLFHLQIPGFSIMKYLACVVDRPLGLILIFPDKDQADCFWRCAKQRYSVSPSFDFVSSRGDAKYLFKSSKAYRHFSNHEKFLVCSKILKKGRSLLRNAVKARKIFHWSYTYLVSWLADLWLEVLEGDLETVRSCLYLG